MAISEDGPDDDVYSSYRARYYRYQLTKHQTTLFLSQGPLHLLSYYHVQPVWFDIV